MKVSFMRACAPFALALALAGCGGKATFEVGGPVVGLKYPGLVISNLKNGDSVAVAPTTPAGNTTFTMPKTVEYGAEYQIKVTTDPAHQTCLAPADAETAGRLASIVVTVSCTTHTFNIGGTVSGLRAADTTSPATGLVLNNGATQVAINNNGTYVFPVQVAYGETYGVTVLKQPSNPARICTVSNGTGTMAQFNDANKVDQINITCV